MKKNTSVLIDHSFENKNSTVIHIPDEPYTSHTSGVLSISVGKPIVCRPQPGSMLEGLAGIVPRPHADASAPAAAFFSYAVDIPESEAMFSYLRSLMTRLDAEKFSGCEPHYAQVCSRLAAKGETCETMRAVLRKAKRLDYLAATAGGGVKSIPGMVADIFKNPIPEHFKKTDSIRIELSETAKVAATFAGVEQASDVGGGQLLSLGLVPIDDGDRYYLAPNRNKLVEPVRQVMEAMSPNIINKAWQKFMLGQTATVRNALVVIPFRSIIEKSVANGVRIPLGMLQDFLYYYIEYSARRFGPLWLLGRSDWEGEYDKLKQVSAGDLTADIARKIAMLPVDSIRFYRVMLAKLISPGKLAESALGVAGPVAASIVRALVKSRIEAVGGQSGLADAAGKIAALPVRSLANGAGFAIEEPVDAGARKLSEWADMKLPPIACRNTDGERNRE
ncbi:MULTISPECIES: hypothetical protein [Burkholderia]|uniref:hypothetical protein n=1 Tax=Burkholderia TaxID=32008 RepID=UPI000B2FD7DA|nr:MULTISPECIES: hypothetical protein [unclassified Burkholderia]